MAARHTEPPCGGHGASRNDRARDCASTQTPPQPAWPATGTAAAWAAQENRVTRQPGTRRPLACGGAGQRPRSHRIAGAGAPALPRGAIDGTLKCYPPGCYDGSHLRGSASSGRWPGLRGGRRTLRAAVLACCAAGLAGCASGTPGSQSTALPDRTVSAPASTAATGDPQALARQAYLGMWQAFTTASRTADYQSPTLDRYAAGSALPHRRPGVRLPKLQGHNSRRNRARVQRSGQA
jgi:hypothetical protein